MQTTDAKQLAVKGIHHVGLAVGDLGRSVRFYGEILGMTLVKESQASGPVLAEALGLPSVDVRFAVLEVGGVSLELLQYLSPASARVDLRISDVGSAHLCFDVDDLDGVMGRLRSFGVGLLSPPMSGVNSTTRNVYAVDPDGYRVQLREAGSDR